MNIEALEKCSLFSDLQTDSKKTTGEYHHEVGRLRTWPLATNMSYEHPRIRDLRYTQLRVGRDLANCLEPRSHRSSTKVAHPPKSECLCLATAAVELWFKICVLISVGVDPLNSIFVFGPRSQIWVKLVSRNSHSTTGH